jgi:O-antigen/teichoic acid export membrane protein
MHFVLILVALAFTLIFWITSSSVHLKIGAETLLLLMIAAPYYLWSVNSNAIFSSFDLTFKQEWVILATRASLLIALSTMIIFKLNELNSFLLIYGLILTSGALVEMLLIGKPWRVLKKLDISSNLLRYANLSFWTHVDYLSFNIFPLILMLIASIYLSTVELGKINFVIQLINFIFLFSVVASIRIKTYIAFDGSVIHAERIFKILIGTIAISLLSFTVMYLFVESGFFHKHFPSFGSPAALFLITLAAVPGYMAYQFIYPILIERNRLKSSAIFNGINFMVFSVLAMWVIPIYGMVAVCVLFSLFHIGVLIIQLYLYHSLTLN